MTKDNFLRYKPYSNIKIQKLDPLAAALDEVGMTGGASKIYIKSLKKDAKPLIDKSLKQFPLKDRQFKGLEGAPINIKKDMLTINKLQKVNQENAMFGRVNPSLVRDTRKTLKEMENKIRLNFRKTDQDKKNTEENRIFRQFLREQKARRTISTDFS